MHRRIEFGLLIEELVKAFDVVQAGVDAHEQVLSELLVEAEKDDPKADLAGWDTHSQIAYRKKVHAQVLYRSLFASSWAALEQVLRDLCRDLRGDLGLSLSERDLAGTGVRRSVKYLRAVAGIELDLNSLGWSQVTKYGDLRNHLMHVGSNLDEARNPVKTRAAFAEIAHVEIEPAGEITLDHDFVLEAIGMFARLVDGIFDGIVGLQGSN